MDMDEATDAAFPGGLLAKLREIDATLTAAPWDVWRERTDTRDAAISELMTQVSETEPFAGAVFLLNAGGKCPATTGCGPTSEANANALAELRNLLPEILAALTASPPHPIWHGEREALRQAVATTINAAWALCDDTAEGDSDAPQVPRGSWKRLSDALDALEALIPESEQPCWPGVAARLLTPTGSAEPEIPAGSLRDAVELLCKRADAVQEISGGTVQHSDLYVATVAVRNALAKPAASQSGGDALREALDPWWRCWAIAFAPFDRDGSVSGRSDDVGAAPLMPTAWPTIGDLRRLAALSHPTTTAADKAGDGAK